jgi:uncharacterized membrane protein SpoIIM required for sporulation/ABC-type transport system involved in multi-copper enzyme maturation permease subunit
MIVSPKVTMKARMDRVLAVIRREVRDQSRDWRVVLPMTILTVFFPILMNVTARVVINFVNQYGARVLAESVFPFLLLIVGFFPTSVALVIALESFVGEKERATIEPLLASPLTDAELFLGKLMASILTPLASALLGITVYLVGMALFADWTPSFSLFFLVLMLTIAHALMMVSAAVVISAQTNSVRAANLLASFIIIPAALLMQAEAVIMFWRMMDALWGVLAAVLLLAAIFVRIGLRQFRREELLAHEVEEIRFDKMFLTFWRAFTGGARNPWQWYRKTVFPAIRRSIPSIGWATVAISMSIPIGFYFAYLLPIPADLLHLSDFRARFLDMVGQTGFFSAGFTRTIIFSNIRALALAALLGVFSLGVLGLIVLMLPFAIIVYVGAILAGAGMPWPAFLAGFVLPHGIIEIPEMLLAGGMILRWGACLLARPEGRSLGDVWLEAMADSLAVFMGAIIPMLVLAALLEAWVTPIVGAWILGAIGW